MSKNHERNNGCVLYRRILHGNTVRMPVGPDLKTVDPRVTDQIQMILRELPFVHAVLDPIDRCIDGEQMADWTSLRPPFTRLWIESVTKEMWVGALFVTLDPKPDKPPRMIGYGFGQKFTSPSPALLAMMLFQLDEEGTVVDTDSGHLNNSISREEDYDRQIAVLYPLTRTIQIMTANNVGMMEVLHDRATRKYLRRTCGERIDDYRYHVLTLRDHTKRAVSEGGDGSQAGLMPLHVARGHWARYGAKYNAGKLFGRIEGKFWVPDHERGKASNGRIRKDYKIAPPESPSHAASGRASSPSPEELRFIDQARYTPPN